ncbi:MAG: hypothetical protein WDN09_03615 [bacterium]
MMKELQAENAALKDQMADMSGQISAVAPQPANPLPAVDANPMPASQPEADQPPAPAPSKPATTGTTYKNQSLITALQALSKKA